MAVHTKLENKYEDSFLFVFSFRIGLICAGMNVLCSLVWFLLASPSTSTRLKFYLNFIKNVS